MTFPTGYRTRPLRPEDQREVLALDDLDGPAGLAHVGDPAAAAAAPWRLVGDHPFRGRGEGRAGHGDQGQAEHEGPAGQARASLNQSERSLGVQIPPWRARAGLATGAVVAP